MNSRLKSFLVALAQGVYRVSDFQWGVFVGAAGVIIAFGLCITTPF